MKIKNLMIIFSLVLLAYIIYSVGPINIVNALKDIKLIYIPIVIFFTFMDFVFTTYKWDVILKYQKINIKFSEAFKINLISYFYGIITPMRAGFFIKVKLLKDKLKSSIGESLPNVFLDRFLDFFTLLVLSILASLYLINTKINFIPEKYLYMEIIFLCLFVLSIWFLLSRNRSRHILGLVHRFLVPKKFKEYARNNYNAFYLNIPKKRKLIYPLFLAFLNYLSYFTGLYFIVLALGIKLDYSVFLILYPIVMSFSLLPITLSGLGTRDVASIALFNLFGVSASSAVALSLLTFLFNDFLLGMTGFILSLKKNDSINNNSVS